MGGGVVVALNAMALTRPLYSEAHSRGRDVAAGYRRGKTGSASDGQGLPVPLYQCKTDYFLGQRGHFTFYKPPLLLLLPFFFFFSGLTIILKAEGRQGRRARHREKTQTERKKKVQMKSIFGMPETSGFIFGVPPKGNCK